ncbi:MAG: peroxiredoxin [Pseudomonadota bacterium]
MSISVGDTLPEFTFKVMTADGPADKTTADIFAGKKVILFAVPGAYTPACHGQHLPGFVDLADDIKAKGVDTIACVAINDIFVLTHWAKDGNASEKIEFLSDGNADFTKKLGLDFDGSGFGLGTRSKRYAMIVEDSKISLLNVEEVPSSTDVSNAQTILQAL